MIATILLTLNPNFIDDAKEHHVNDRQAGGSKADDERHDLVE